MVVATSLILFLPFLVVNVASLGSLTTPITTPPTTPPPPQINFFSTYGASEHRKDKMLNSKPLAVIKGVSRTQCLGLCLRRKSGKTKSCKSFNYGNQTCFLLNTFICDGDKTLTDAPGFSYYDLVTDYTEEMEFFQSNQCKAIGRCSNRCRKFKLIKTPLSWREAHAACRKEQALLAMPKTMKDQLTVVDLMKKANILQSWIGLTKKDGKFFYDDGTPLTEDFNVWGPDQPNDSGGTQQCVQIMSEMEYMWNDFDCARPVGFVCQYVW